MKISLNTETEEIAELRAAVAIIEDAIKRRENEGYREENNYNIETNYEAQNIEPKIEAKEEPIAPQQPQHVQQPLVAPVEKLVRIPPPPVDMSALSKSDRKIESKRMDQPPLRQPMQDNKAVVRSIIQTLKDRNRGGPIQMTDIVNMARIKNIGEEEARRLVNDLQRASSI